MMILMAVAALTLGAWLGNTGIGGEIVAKAASMTDVWLVILMVLVGISVGARDGLLSKLRELKFTAVAIPLFTIIGTLIGGALCSPLAGMPLNISVSIAAGLGWYSLSGVTMTTLAGAEIGAITFLSNLMREIISFVVIPVAAKFLNYSSAISSAAATSEDTTLGMLIKCTDAEHVVLAVINGVVCSAAVPILLPLTMKL